MISLRESTRKAKRDKSEKVRLQRANARRLAKGLAPLKADEKIPSEDKAPDLILEESKRILADLIFHFNPDSAESIAKAGKGQKIGAKPGTAATGTDIDKEKNN